MTWSRWYVSIVVALVAAGCGDDAGGGDNAETGGSASASDGETSVSSTAADVSTSGSGSASGTGGDAPIHDCIPAEGGLPTNPEQKTGVDGTNGLFVDQCDENGDLLDYMCTLPCIEYDQGPNPVCIEYGPGEATEVFYDCLGTCTDGTCDGRCPTHGHQLEILSIEADAFGFENQADGRTYACTLAADMPDDTFDCTTDLTAGQTIEITTLGLSSAFCTGPDFGSFGIGTPQTCTFTCSIAP